MYNNSADFLTAGNSGLVSSVFTVKILESEAMTVPGVMPANVSIALSRLWAIMNVFVSSKRIRKALERDLR